MPLEAGASANLLELVHGGRGPWAAGSVTVAGSTTARATVTGLETQRGRTPVLADRSFVTVTAQMGRILGPAAAHLHP